MICAKGDESWPLLEEVRARANLVVATNPASMSEAIARADIVLVTDFRSRQLRDAWPDAAPVRWVHATSAGVDALTFPQIVESDIVVTNARGVFDTYIAEYVLGCVIAFAKDFLGNLAHQRAHRWHYRQTQPVQGKRLLVFGAGSVGGAIARLARAAGMRVDGIGREEREDPSFDAVHADADLHALLPAADFVVVAAPLTKATRHRFDAAAFRRMQASAYFINVGRGPIVDTSALVSALEGGEIAGAALDVFEEEPLPGTHPLWDMTNVMLTPHQAGDILGWQEIVIRQFLRNLDRWLHGEPLINVVDKRHGFIPAGEAGSQEDEGSP